MEFDRNLNYINDNLSNELQNSLKKIISGIYEEENGYPNRDNNRDDEDKIFKSRQAIKEKAMKQDVHPVRHLMNDEERQAANSTNPKKNSPKTEESPKKKENARTRKRKIKKDILDKLTNAERKKRIPISPRAIKRIHNCSDSDNGEESCSENEESDGVNNKADDDDDDIDDDDKNIDDDDKKNDDNLNLEPVVLLERLKTFDNTKAVTPDAEENKKQKENTEENAKDNEQELDIQIDTLPVLIRTEDQGKLYEIEIIDSLKDKEKEPTPAKTERKYDKKLTALKKISLMPGLSIKKINHPQETEVPSTSTANDLANITEIKEVGVSKERQKGGTAKKPAEKMPGIPQPERRDLKRVHMQSKLKRLGMLPIANFEAPEDLEPATGDEQDTEGVEAEKNLGLDVIED